MRIPLLYMVIIILIFEIQVYSQSFPTEGLFEFDSWIQKKNINISERVQDIWDISESFMQIVYYNAHKDNLIDSVQSISQVLYLNKLSNGKIDVLELIDEGDRFDCEANDGIFGNILLGAFTPEETAETIVDVQFDTLGIQYQILNLLVKKLLETPKISAPQNDSYFFTETEKVIWSIDPNADGCEIILLNSLPVIGQNYKKDAIWTMKYESKSNHLYKVKIPIPLLINEEYYLIIIAYSNTKIINNEWSHGSYSMEIAKFYNKGTGTQLNNFSCRCFPNPFNSNLFINYTLPQNGKVSIQVFNAIGEKVITLFNREQTKGNHSVIWDGKDHQDINASSGLYFYRIIFKDQSLSNKTVLLR